MGFSILVALAIVPVFFYHRIAGRVRELQMHNAKLQMQLNALDKRGEQTRQSLDARLTRLEDHTIAARDGADAAVSVAPAVVAAPDVPQAKAFEFDTPAKALAPEPETEKLVEAISAYYSHEEKAAGQAPATPPASASYAPSEAGFPEHAFAAAKDWVLGGNPLLRVGVALLFFGLAFLLRYAAEQFSPPVEYRYIGVALTALVLLTLGWRLRREKPAYGLMLQGAGIAVLYLTTFAAMRLHPLLAPGAAFGILILVTACSALLAVAQNALGLAMAAALGGFAAPILTSTGSGNHVALFSYFAILNTGILLIAWFKAWRSLNLIGFIGTFGIGFAWGLRAYNPALFASTEPFLLLFFLMYVGIGLLFARKKPLEALSAPDRDGRDILAHWSRSQADYVDGVLMFGPPLAGFGLQCAVIEHIEYGMAFSALLAGLFYMLLAIFLHRRALSNRGDLLVEICLALGVVFGTLTIPLALDAQWTSAAWAVEGAGIYWIGLRQSRRLARVAAFLLIAVAALTYLNDVGAGSVALLTGSPLGAAMLGAALLFCHRCLRLCPQEKLRAWETACLPVLAVSGLAFLYLIAPLCFDLDLAVITWALAGLATFFVGLRLASRPFLFCALGIQLLGGLIFLSQGTGSGAYAAAEGATPLAHFGFWTPAALSLAALAGAWRMTRAVAVADANPLPVFSPLLLLWSVGWWVWTVIGESARFAPDGSFEHIALLVLSASAIFWMGLARRAQWRNLALACLLPLVVAAWGILRGAGSLLAYPGMWTWSLFFVAHFLILRRLAALLPERILTGAHVLGCWLLVGVLSLTVCDLTQNLVAAWNAWRWLGWALAPALYLLAMASKRDWRWPIAAFPVAYRRHAALPIALGLLLWFWCANFVSNGASAPLPYLPLANPLELELLIALAIGCHWSLRVFPEQENLKWKLQIVLGVSLLALLTMSVCRTVHHWGGVAFHADALLASMRVQAGWSLVWTLYALALMIGGNRRGQRALWGAGAALVGVVVVKLFFVELSDSGSWERIVSFIGVGILLLVVGYFSPLPPVGEQGAGIRDREGKS
ncbi:MAG: DUF2339 domain-containing protein [Zoogloeaceae bacterium]|jgi:uncharacterized membrane protein|nr:DUF2339 domain-containing protein [Zoogloeaceae bacterium]